MLLVLIVISCFNLILLWFNLNFDDQLQVDSKIDEKTFPIFSEGRKTKQFTRACESFTTPNSPCENFTTPNSPCENFTNPKCTLWKFRKGCKNFANQLCLVKFEKPVQTCFTNQLCLAKTLWNLKEVANLVRNSKTHFATLRIPTVSMLNTNGQWERQRSLKKPI